MNVRRFLNIRAIGTFTVISLVVMGLYVSQTGGPEQTPLTWALTTLGLTALMVGASAVLLAVLAFSGQGGVAVGQAQRLVGQGQTGAALERYNQAIARRPQGAEARVGRAELLIEQNELLPALDDLNAAITSTPHVSNFPDPILYRAYLQRGRVRHFLGDRKGGITDWNQASRLAPGQPEPYLLRGRVELEEGHHYQGQAELSWAIKLASGVIDQPRQDKAPRVAMLNLRGLAYTLLDQPQRGLADLEAALALDPSAWAVHLNLAATYLALGHRDPALAALTEAIALNPLAAAAARRSPSFRALQGDPIFEGLLAGAARPALPAR